MNIDPATGATEEAAPEEFPEPRPLPQSSEQPSLSGAGEAAEQPAMQTEEEANGNGDAGESGAIELSPNRVNTEPLGTIVTAGGKDTTPLPENAGPPSPPLSEGAVVNGRYQVAAYLGAVRDTNIYRVADLQGYRRCWACGSDSSMPGDIYCVECGAQLAGRFYRLQEFNLPPVGDRQPVTEEAQRTLPEQSEGTQNGAQPATGANGIEQGPEPANEEASGEPPTGNIIEPDDFDPAAYVEESAPAPESPSPDVYPDPYQATIEAWHSAIKIPPPILENRVAGVAHVYDMWVDEAAQRAYIAWEEASGRLLSSWLPGAPVTDELSASQSGHLAVPQEPEEEQVLAWMVQATDLLVRLHDEGISGCSLDLANLLVLPGDRVLLIDPLDCNMAGGQSMQEQDASELSDVRALAGQLESWYMAVRKETAQADGEPGPLAEPAAGAAVSPMPMVAAYEETGPLGRNMNPAVALARAREGSYPTAEAFAEVLHDLYEASKPLTNLKLWSGRSSDLGRVRKINEDSVLTLEATVLEHDGNLPVALYVIADGMGGHQSGEVASSIAIRTIGSVVNSSLIGPLVSGDPVARDATTCGHLLQQAVLEANRRITELARERHSDLGTTTVVALLIGNQLTVANVGDSRAYIWHDDTLQVLTRDHSLVMQLVLAGQIKPEDIYTHPRRNEIYRALGDSRLTEEEVDVYTQRLRPGDGLLLCSDGLWDFVRDPDIAATLASPGDPQSQTQVLVDQANTNGGEDNISVIFARVMAGEE
jgi:serine/threonine protein phosphatase PrpC